eukprot:GEMP01056148.1.p1 GENE.GEMP01056148.1~~GEMP01056148.1.p1  ORF type:complete len:117 (-),score=2.43 GEMP01056148.1:12-362(-)
MLLVLREFKLSEPWVLHSKNTQKYFPVGKNWKTKVRGNKNQIVFSNTKNTRCKLNPILFSRAFDHIVQPMLSVSTASHPGMGPTENTRAIQRYPGTPVSANIVLIVEESRRDINFK